jgi:hypothetical protein
MQDYAISIENTHRGSQLPRRCSSQMTMYIITNAANGVPHPAILSHLNPTCSLPAFLKSLFLIFAANIRNVTAFQLLLQILINGKCYCLTRRYTHDTWCYSLIKCMESFCSIVALR